MHDETLYKQILTETQASQQQTEHEILRQIRQKAKWVKQVIQHTHSALETDQTLQDNCMFACVHLMHEEGWWLVGTVIITHTNFFSSQ